MAEMWISMGPQHPMTHGLWTLKVKIDGEISLRLQLTVTVCATLAQIRGPMHTSMLLRIYSKWRSRHVQNTSA